MCSEIRSDSRQLVIHTDDTHIIDRSRLIVGSAIHG